MYIQNFLEEFEGNFLLILGFPIKGDDDFISLIIYICMCVCVGGSISVHFSCLSFFDPKIWMDMKEKEMGGLTIFFGVP